MSKMSEKHQRAWLSQPEVWQALKLLVKTKTCLLCDALPPQAEACVFFPKDSEEYGGTKDSQRIFYYVLCESCSESSLDKKQSLVEEKLLAIAKTNVLPSHKTSFTPKPMDPESYD